MGILLALAGYLAAGVFLFGVTIRLIRVARAPGPAVASRPSDRCAPVLLTLFDVFFLRRLFLTNKGLWIGEWVFHVAFVAVAMRHFRFFLEPVPDCIVAAQPLGRVAGVVLPGALSYIVLYRAVARTRFISARNLVLTLLLLLAGVTGLMMGSWSEPDLLAIKHFVLTVLAFRPGRLSEGAVVVIHVLAALAFLAALPSHILAAPLTIYEAERREARRPVLLREDSVGHRPGATSELE